jgi:hypothetical protein
MNLEVCIYCAITAQEIGLEIEVLPKIADRTSTDPYGV